jgi:hypothetical protein
MNPSDPCARCGHARRFHGPHDLKQPHHKFADKPSHGVAHPRAQVIGTNPDYCGENPMCTCLKFVEQAEDVKAVAAGQEDLW